MCHVTWSYASFRPGPHILQPNTGPIVPTVTVYHRLAYVIQFVAKRRTWYYEKAGLIFWYCLKEEHTLPGLSRSTSLTFVFRPYHHVTFPVRQPANSRYITSSVTKWDWLGMDGKHYSKNFINVVISFIKCQILKNRLLLRLLQVIFVWYDSLGLSKLF